MHHHCIFLLVAVLLGSFARPLSPRWDDTGMHTKHSWSAVPKSGRAWAARLPAPLYIGLKHGVHLSNLKAKEKAGKLVAPHPETLKLVNSRLEQHGVPSSSVSMTHGGSTLSLKGMSVTQANALLDALYQLYRHVETSETIVLTVGAAAGQGDSAYGKPSTMLSSCINVKYHTPSRRHFYAGVTSYTRCEGPECARDCGEYPSTSDLTAFMSIYRCDADDATLLSNRSMTGGYDPSQPHPEPDMDIQDIDWFVSWFGYMLYEETIGTSYTINEDGLSKADATSVCVAPASSSRVVTMVSAKGTAWALSSSGSHFPTTCPWITVVGGTTGYQPEVAASFSGGGFLERPKYQKQAVSTFLQDLGSGYQGLYNARHRHAGRRIPDRHNNEVIYDGTGTSGVTPFVSHPIWVIRTQLTANLQVVAGIISHCNDWLIWRGEPPLGFLNPWLYGSGCIALNDITVGSNPGYNND
ncbi:hypothetical protein EDB89DRAFT_1909746 [Lactarius sanguifluus]|nr:hypothetical protein EDB89DRAFT_1909746 [Lactarius sanguifluus]